jgi:hypothetical protein
MHAIRWLVSSAVLLSLFCIRADAQDSLNVRKLSQLVDYWDQTCDIEATDTIVYVATGEASGLQIVNVADHEHPRIIGHVDGLGACIRLARLGNYLYVSGDTTGFHVLDLTNPVAPVPLGAFQVTGYGRLFIWDVQRCIAYGGYGFTVLDMADPVHPVERGTWQTTAGINGWAAAGDNVYVFETYAGVHVVNVSNPNSPTETGNISLYNDGYPSALAARGNYLFAGSGDSLWIVSMVDPTAPVITGRWVVPIPIISEFYSISLRENYAYLSTYSLYVVDISDLEHPVTVSDSVEAIYTEDQIAMAGDYGYLSTEGEGLRAIYLGVPARPFALPTFYPGGLVTSVAVRRDFAYVTDGTWGYGGVRFIRVSDREHPTQVSRYTYGLWRTAQVTAGGDSIYVLTDQSVVKLDISDPRRPVDRGSYSLQTTGYDMCLCQSDSLLIVGTANGLEIIRTFSHGQPIRFSDFATHCVAVSGTHAYACTTPSGLRVIDISDPAHPQYRSHCSVQGLPRDIVLTGQFALVAHEQYGVAVIDVSDTLNPVVVDSLDTPGYALAIVIDDTLAYVADSTGGLRVLSLANLPHLVEVGFYDTPGAAVGVAVQDGYVYLADGADFSIYQYSPETGVVRIDKPFPPATLALRSCYPNPFNPATTIRYDVAASGRVTLDIYNVLGRRVTSLFDGMQTAGSHQIVFDGSGYSSGIYFVHLQQGHESATRKIALMK